MPQKKNIFVIMGGKSPEHEISVISGREVVNNLNSGNYNVFPVVIDRKGLNWTLTSKKSLNLMKDPMNLKGTSKEIVLSKKSVYQSIGNIPQHPDVVFIAMHGPFGEDGTVQGMLDLAGIRYTGSGVLASALGMDKLMFRKVMKAEGVVIPKYISLKKGNEPEKVKNRLGDPPYFVKPNSQGSSVGACLVRKYEDLERALAEAWKYDDIALVDEYIKGKEVTCSVMGNYDPITLPLVEIIPKKAEFFDYNSKYTESGSEEIVPARISEYLSEKVRNVAVKVHQIIGCRGFSRVDFILKNNRTPIVLEINTIPGLTPMSLFPKAAKAYGLSYPDLLDKIISYAEE